MYPILAVQEAPGEIISGGFVFWPPLRDESHLAVKRSGIWLLNDCESHCPRSSVRFWPVLLG